MIIILAGSVAGAATTIYTSRTAWESAVGAYQEEFFDDAILNPGVSVVSSVGYITDGVWWDRLAPPYENTTTTWQFTPAIYAYGGNWDLAGPGGLGTSVAVSINGVSVGQILNTYSGQFWGFVSTEPFSSVLLKSGSTPGSAETYEMDNMVYAFAGGLEFTKIDDVNDGDCVVPGREVNYTITYNYNGAGDTNVTIIDYLPVEIDYNSSSPAGDYNAVNRTVTWNIGTAPPNSNGTFMLKAIVNYAAEPCSVFTNSCRIEGTSTDKVAEVNTPVCYWNQIIYVDHNATGVNNGLTWANAYLDLQDALDRAAAEGHSEIWVASGTYGPSVFYQNYPTFRLIDGVPMYGHFAGNETSISQRDFNDANSETILNRVGAIWPQYVVTASGLSRNNVVDGFTIKESTYASVRIENAYLAISNCIIAGGSGNGINATNSTFTANDCVIQNKSNGIYVSSSIFEIDNCIIQNNNSRGISVDFAYNGTLYGSRISNCIIQKNAAGNGIYLTKVPLSSSIAVTGCEIYGNAAGIYTQNGSCASIFDNLIYKNSSMGILLQNPGLTTIRNNTIVGHTSYGISCMDGGTTPVISNCIVWGNIDDLYSCTATYSCTDNNNDAGTGNIHTDPCFVNADANDFHLRPRSLCIDAGDPNFNDFNYTDIDGEYRIMFGKTALRVDIGADELRWLKADFDRNEIVNFADYAIWASAWQTTNPNKSLDSDNDVDIEDLSQFCDDWLWEVH